MPQRVLRRRRTAASRRIVTRFHDRKQTREAADTAAVIGDEWWRPLPRGFPADALRVLAGLILVPFAPNLAIAIGLLLARNAPSQMDVPTRTSHVMTAVTPEERPAAAGITAVPRSLASAASPILAGYLLTLSTFGWPLVIGGALKGMYDILLLIKFRGVRTAEERRATCPAR